MNALGALVILFAAMSVISALALLIMLLVKDEKKKKILCYFLGIWGMLIAWMSADSLPSNYIVQQIIAWGFGVLGVVGLLIQICGKSSKHAVIARVLVSLSVVLGLLYLFFF